MIKLPTPYAAAKIAAFLAEHLCWTAFWDKRDGTWLSPAVEGVHGAGVHVADGVVLVWLGGSGVRVVVDGVTVAM